MAKVHRAYRHKWWRRSKEITMRDCQAMSNFASEKISHETIAEHFGCDIAVVSHAVFRRPWLLSKAASMDLGQTTTGRSWWESDHSDPLELVKMFYPQYLDYFTHTSSSFQVSKEKQSKEYVMDWDAYMEQEYGTEYGSVKWETGTFFQEIY